MIIGESISKYGALPCSGAGGAGVESDHGQETLSTVAAHKLFVQHSSLGSLPSDQLPRPNALASHQEPPAT